MRTSLIDSSRGWRHRGFVAVALSVVMVGAGLPSPVAASQAQVSREFLLLDGRVVQARVNGDAIPGAILSGAGGSFEIVVERARFPEDRNDDSTGVVPTLRPEVRVLGNDPVAEVKEATGRDLGGVEGWAGLYRMTLRGDRDSITSTQSAGTDTVEMTIPRAFFTDPDGFGVIEISVNGAAAWIDFASMRRVAEDLAAGRPPEAPELAGLAAHLQDAPGFAAASVAGVRVTEALLLREAGLHTRGNCVIPCLNCAGAIGKLGLAQLSVIGACGTIPFTSGLMAMACITSLGGTFVLALGAMTGCAACASCLGAPPPDHDEDEDDDCHPCDWGSSDECQGVPPPWCT